MHRTTSELLSTMVRGLHRGLSSQARQAGVSGFVELREYTIKPSGIKDYISMCQQSAPIRGQLLPFLGMFTCDLGGSLNRLVHLYHYEDYDARDAARKAAAGTPEWRDFVDTSRQHLEQQESKILLEAKAVYESIGISSVANFKPAAASTSTHSMRLQDVVIYELRNYQLHPGYGSVPKLLEAFAKGLPHKLAADKEGQLAMFGYTDVGTLNNVVELWRYPSAQACIRARQASRSVPQWRETISAVTPGVQFFTSSFMHPTAFSPMK